VVTLTATANPGWTFAGWTGDAIGAANPVTVTMSANKAVTANYTQNAYALTVTSAHGAVEQNPLKATHTYGEVVTLTATADLGWTFRNWTGDATGTANPIAVTMDGNKAVTANYAQCMIGRIFGAVVDGGHGDAPIPGATVVIVGPDSVRWDVTSDDNGLFSLSPAPNGLYTIKATAAGYQGFAEASTEVNCTDMSVVLRLTPNEEEQPPQWLIYLPVVRNGQ
jgi:uncharacterized repeat protein (TIGR02543 family)